MTDVSTFRLYLLRAMYLLIVVGLGSDIWPAMLHHRPWDLWHGVGCSLLAAVTVMAAIGIRYPLQMLPLMFFEMIWKTIWLVGIALAQWLAHQVDPNIQETIRACLMGVVLVPLITPWPYVWANWVRKPGDRWGRRGMQGGARRGEASVAARS